MLLKGKVGKVGSANSDLPINEQFLACLKVAIEDQRLNTKLPSKSYSPSQMNCIRSMYYKRIGVIPDNQTTVYTDVGMADTGTRRHEAIQEALEFMNSSSKCRFVYVDVAKYVEKKQAKGKCTDLVITGKVGAETKLYDSVHHVNFRCDGIILDKVTSHFYLFEFKNQISFKAAGKRAVDLAHHIQVTAYCTLLDLADALVVYENRDNCELFCPEVYHVSEYDKAMLLDRIETCEQHVRSGSVPKLPDSFNTTMCKWCPYKFTCRKDSR